MVCLIYNSGYKDCYNGYGCKPFEQEYQKVGHSNAQCAVVAELSAQQAFWRKPSGVYAAAEGNKRQHENVCECVESIKNNFAAQCPVAEHAE
jgi:hypothetical protein